MKDPFRIRELRFDQFHDLMHRPFTAECRVRYGGSRQHLKLWWEYIARRRLAYHLCCRVGRHRWCAGWSREHGNCWLCLNCLALREK